ncbi:GNAT family N-acetyltransferase [Homoserinimonas sp. OAct 916]|uniref:GNAT family N-acetyltransferase n=1 Tax=Homoserinimonas sp. OAct 916 TaxID=2211450 RepID=UPI000DBE4700|nr:GNAT family N-acetyltransferase [Homoserinimonas sp. OAct 916]
MVSSLGFRTDLMLLQLQGSTIEQHDGYLCVRTPSNPTFRWGNFILLDATPHPGSLRKWVDVFRQEFPHAEYVAIGIDSRGGDSGGAEELLSVRLRAESSPVMTATQMVPPSRRVQNVDTRVLDVDKDNDWAAAIALQVANNTEEEPRGYTTFLIRRMATLRALQREGHGAWFGAFAGDLMVSGCGVFSDGSGVARYQSVDTHPDYRRRGLGATVVHAAGTYALNTLGARTLVIVADPESGADRVYRSVGFTATETETLLEKTDDSKRERQRTLDDIDPVPAGEG